MKLRKTSRNKDKGQKTDSTAQSATETPRSGTGLGIVEKLQAVLGQSAPSSSSKVVPLRPTKAGPTHEQIAARAHALWLQKGCELGQDQQNWLEAEAQLRAELEDK